MALCYLKGRAAEYTTFLNLAVLMVQILPAFEIAGACSGNTLTGSFSNIKVSLLICTFYLEGEFQNWFSRRFLNSANGKLGILPPNCFFIS